MQSLKSTAFAVTLLAISFGLYCVSSNDDAMQQEIELGGIQLDEGLQLENGTSINSLTTTPNYVGTGATNKLAASGLNSSGNIGLPDLPPMPSLNSTSPPTLLGSPKNKLENSPANRSMDLSLDSNASGPSVPDLPNLSLGGQQVSTRQPVSSSLNSPNARDDGLIDALKTDFKPAGSVAANALGGGFKPATANSAFANQPIAGNASSGDSYNSLAGAIAKDSDDRSVRNAVDSTPFKPVGMNAAAAVAKPASINEAWPQVDALTARNDFRGALSLLSQFYRSQDLTGPQQQKLQGYLDALAGKVIYSPEHHLVGQGHAVQTGETLNSIAQRYKVPADVIYNINQQQFAGATEVRPGMNLKVVAGPFHAEISQDSKTMTLFIQDLYAGRFPVSMGVSGDPEIGTYAVMAKSATGYTWRDAAGKDYPPESPENGYGPSWIGLSGSLCIHAVADATPHGHRGCIGLSTRDAKDVYGMLSKDSKVTIVR